jgi:tRNA (guanine37-N1)-methyltransferase
MRWTILTLFPEMFTPLQTSILGRATKAGKLQIELVNFRDYSTDKHRKVDDNSYSPGAGLVLSCQPIYDCLQAIDPEHKAHRIFMTPAAPILTQNRVVELSQYEHIIILCGHYEGVDQRVIDACFDEVISIGEFVLTGGEIPAMVLVDAVSRYVSGVINQDSLIMESYVDGKLEYPQYTRPRVWNGMAVPEVLFSGNHAAIQKWKDEASADVTEKFKLKQK